MPHQARENSPDPLRPYRPAVVLVGAGPGDPELVTLRGVRRLAEADVVLYDYLANARLLEHCRPDAELVCLGKHGRDRIVTQDEINRRMVAEASAGKLVVRLKGGDPAVFARFGDEIGALEAAGLRYEVVPGITTALAVGSHAAIPLTDRRTASAVALVTGHEQGEQELSKIDYAGLAGFPGTLVFYMGVIHAPIWTRALIDSGKSADTPAAVIRRCSWPDQQTIITTLGEVVEVIKTRQFRPPIVVVVGEVIDYRAVTSWFTDRPLFGRRILVTRPDEESSFLSEMFRQLGADVVVQPAIEIGEPQDFTLFDDALGRLGRFDWIAFSSANGVRSVMSRLSAIGRDVRAFGAAKIAAIGPGTSAELRRFNLQADLVPAEFRAESLAAALAERVKLGERKVLLIRASRGREVLAETLTAAGAEVEQVVAYRSTDVVRPTAEVAALAAAGKIDWVTVTSSAIARSLTAMFGPALGQMRLVSISPITSATLRELGLSPAAEATEFTFAGLVAAVLRGEQR